MNRRIRDIRIASIIFIVVFLLSIVGFSITESNWLLIPICGIAPLIPIILLINLPTD